MFCKAPSCRQSNARKSSLRVRLACINWEAADQRSAAAAAQARHDATVRLVALRCHVGIPLVAHVCGNTEDCNCHEGAGNTTAHDCTCVVMWVWNIYSCLLPDSLARRWDLSLADIARDILSCCCWVL